MFFSPLGLLGGLLSFAGAALNVAWGMTKLVAKATAKAVKGAIRVGRVLYKHGRPLGRKVIRTIKACSGTVLGGNKPITKSNVFARTESEPSSGANVGTKVAKVLANSSKTTNTNPSPQSSSTNIRGVSAPIKKAIVFAGTSATKPKRSTGDGQ